MAGLSLKSSGRSGGRLILARITNSALQFLTIIVIARTSPLADFGNFATGVAQGAILSGIFGLGIPALALQTNQFEQPNETRTMRTLTWAGASLAGGGVFLALAYGLRAPTAVAIAAATYVLAEMAHNFTHNISMGSFRRSAAEWSLILRRGVPFVFVLPAIVWQDQMYALLSAGHLSSAVLAAALMPRSRGKLSVPPVLRAAAPLWANGVSSMLQQLDVTIVNVFLGPAAAGAYSAAFRLASPVHVVTTTLVGLMLPELLQKSERSRRVALGKRYTRVGGAYLILIIVFSPLTLWVGPLLMGAQFQDTAWLFPILMVNSAVSVGNQLLGARIIAERGAPAIARFSALATAVGLVCALLAARYVGLGYVAGAVILIQVLLAAQQLRYWRRLTKEDIANG